MNDFETFRRIRYNVREEFRDIRYIIGIDDFAHPGKYDRGIFEEFLKLLQLLEEKVIKAINNG